MPTRLSTPGLRFAFRSGPGGRLLGNDAVRDIRETWEAGCLTSARAPPLRPNRRLTARRRSRAATLRRVGRQSTARQKSALRMLRKGSSMYSQGTKWLGRSKSRIQEMIAWADRELCAEEDEFAFRRGWTVARSGFGRRLYRDARFDQRIVRVPEEVA